MNYREIVEYLEDIPRFTTKNPLEHTKEFLRRLGSPETGMKVIHVAGTNGKGSVCAYLDSMLRAGGRHVGLFTSPHLVRINERFRIDGKMVSDEDFAEAFGQVMDVVRAALDDGLEHPTYFETLYLMGMLLFQKAGVEYLVLETGLGGRLDCTNTVDRPLACIITSISLDHMEYLGDTVEKIAGEKAGIIKQHVPVVYDGHVPEAARVIEARAEKLGAPCYALAEDRYELLRHTPGGIDFLFRFGQGEETELSIPFIAPYQMMNASLAFFTMECLREEHKIPRGTLKRGIAAARWEGRMETVLPGVIVDGAHNADGAQRFVETAEYFAKDHPIALLFTAVADKEYGEMIRLICGRIRPSAVVTTQIEGKRIVPAETLAGIFRREGCADVAAEENVQKAFDLAVRKKGENGMLFCVGSLYLVGDIKAYLEEKTRSHDQLRRRTEEV